MIPTLFNTPAPRREAGAANQTALQSTSQVEDLSKTRIQSKARNIAPESWSVKDDGLCRVIRMKSGQKVLSQFYTLTLPPLSLPLTYRPMSHGRTLSIAPATAHEPCDFSDISMAGKGNRRAGGAVEFVVCVREWSVLDLTSSWKLSNLTKRSGGVCRTHAGRVRI